VGLDAGRLPGHHRRVRTAGHAGRGVMGAGAEGLTGRGLEARLWSHCSNSPILVGNGSSPVGSGETGTNRPGYLGN
jgi:hypothetical protein